VGIAAHVRVVARLEPSTRDPKGDRESICGDPRVDTRTDGVTVGRPAARKSSAATIRCGWYIVNPKLSVDLEQCILAAVHRAQFPRFRKERLGVMFPIAMP